MLIAPLQLVPQQLAKTEAPQELMIAVNRDHNDICCIDSRSPQLQILSSEINTSTKHVLEVLDRVPEQCKSIPAVTFGPMLSLSQLYDLHCLINRLPPLVEVWRLWRTCK